MCKVLMDFSLLSWPNMGSTESAESAPPVTSPPTSNGWTTTEIEPKQPVPENDDWSTKKKQKKKKKKKKRGVQSRSNDTLIDFYKKDRRFISLPIDDDHKTDLTVRVMTYNILADGHSYALSHRHDYCPLEYRKWRYRFQSILCQLQAYAPDIVCIQEVTPTLWNNKMQQPLQEIGYIGVHAARDQREAQSTGLVQSDCI
eukprot:204392_1